MVVCVVGNGKDRNDFGFCFLFFVFVGGFSGAIVIDFFDIFYFMELKEEF